ncbi:hypothetical protein CHUAL_012448 [Chamberlinius hualienensis]
MASLRCRSILSKQQFRIMSSLLICAIFTIVSSTQALDISPSLSNVVNVSEVLHLNVAQQDEFELANAIKDKIRILCWVMTQPKDHTEKALTVRATWGKRCNILYFVSTTAVTLPKYDNVTVWETEPPLETAVFNGNESRGILWGKVKLGFQYAYDHYFDKADWFLKADDDTYVVLENLRHLLLDKDPADPIYYGCNLNVPFLAKPNEFVSGGAGYVLSKEALKRFIEKSLPDKDLCREGIAGPEDVEISKCLRNVGVTLGDSRDSKGLMRFFPLAPQKHTTPTAKNFDYGTISYWQYFPYPQEWGLECCSDATISFHYIDRPSMYMLEYLIYHLHPFGIKPQLTGSNIKDKVRSYLLQKKPCNITKSIKN